MTLRVLHFIDSLGFGGAELGLARIVERQPPEFEHVVVCIRGGGVTAERLQRAGVKILFLDEPPGHRWSLPLRLARLCRQWRPDVVHTRNWGCMDAVLGAWLARVPALVHAEHGFTIHDVTGGNERQRKLRRVMAFFMDRIVAVSDHLRDLLVSEVGIPAAKVVVIRDGIEVQRFADRSERERTRRELGCGDARILVGGVGRLDPVKNFGALIEAMAALRARRPDLRMVLIGSGPEETRLRQQVEALGLGETCRLLGYRDDVPRLLAALDVFVLPSFAEGTCNAILEAMAASLPVVTTAVAGNPELVVDGETGSLVPPGDVPRLVDAILSYAADEELRRRHGEGGRARVVRLYRSEVMVAEYGDLYRDTRGRQVQRAAEAY